MGTVAAGAGAAFLVSWLDPLGTDAPPVGSGHEARGAAATPASLVTLDPLVVSLAGTNGAARSARRLRVVVTIETNEATARRLAADDPRLRDGLTSAARNLGADALADADGLETLRSAFLATARQVLGESAVTGVLVTDYVIV